MTADQPIHSARCVVCGSEMAARLAADLWRCPRCKYWCSTFPADGNRPVVALNEAERYRALDAVRSRNARTIFGILANYLSLQGARLCDVGCAYGWFLTAAQTLGVNGLGIEPDAPVAARARARGLNVRSGLFPNCLKAHERFDLLAFNDVLEHLPEITQMAEACRAHLLPGGILAVAIPSSSGAIFRAGCALRRLGIVRPFDRLWQRNYPCPHVHYFNRQNLPALLARYGFQLLDTRELPSYELPGLWSRLHMDRAEAPWKAAIAWAALAVAQPVVRRMPADILLQVYRVQDKSNGYQTPSAEARVVETRRHKSPGVR